MRYLLDTNSCIAVMRHVPNVVNHFAATTPTDCAISSITSYELQTGVAKCANPVKEQAKVDLLLKTVQLLPFERSAARQAAQVRALLESQGQPIGPYDVLLAGHALAWSLILVTSNTNEFSRVPGLVLEDWLI